MASKYICISKSFDLAMAEFVDQTKTLVGALGWDLFREVRGRPNEADQDDRPIAQRHSGGNI